MYKCSSGPLPGPLLTPLRGDLCGTSADLGSQIGLFSSLTPLAPLSAPSAITSYTFGDLGGTPVAPP